MRMNQWIEAKFCQLDEISQLKDKLSVLEQKCFKISGTAGSFFSIVSFYLGRDFERSTVLVCSDEEEAKLVYSDLEMLRMDSLYHFPSLALTPYQLGVVSEELSSKRLEVMKGLISGKRMLIVASIEALSFTVIPKERIQQYFKTVCVGEEAGIGKLSKFLIEAGYERVKQVTYPGEFAVRGGILDVYFSSFSNPVRLEFFDEEIEEIKSFHPETQKSSDRLKEIVIPPFREILYDEAMMEIAVQRLAQIGGEEEHRLVIENQIRNFQPFDGEHFYQRLFYEKFCLLDYLEQPLLILNDRETILKKQNSIIQEYETNYSASYNKYRPKFLPGELLFSLDQLCEKSWKTVEANHFKRPDSQPDVEFPIHGISFYSGDLDLFKGDLRRYLADGYKIVVFAVTEVQSKRLSVLFQEFEPEVVSEKKGEVKEEGVSIVPFSLSYGFMADSLKIIFLNDYEIFGKRNKISKHFHTRKTEVIDSFIDLKAGDYVVHIHHGVGRFVGIERVKSQGVEKDYLSILYEDDDKIFIPIEQMNFIQKYVSGDVAQKPKLDRIGSKNWNKTKEKVKESVNRLAVELVKLYSYRLNQKGFAFAPDTPWQKEFEAKFPYEETEDQLLTIEEVKRDMESIRPMDRLICGDVGFGKTEVAIRAAFKAVMSGKQTAILVPTTILTEQHYQTFKERLADYPIKVEMLSRFRTPAQQREVLRDLAAGELDIIIGTHRLLSNDVKYKNLGLLIIDEEHRFGVKHKEKIKQMRMNLDSISMTATPIPRSLHMSLAKIRDMSIINTPPRERLPVETYVMEFREDILKMGIENELARGGQVFFLYNRVKSIHEMERYLESIVPSARVVVAHGQMEAEELENIIHDFINYQYDILLTTTIIESGIDIPRANTIFIDRADRFGLAQLYQLRGRVGRSHIKAFAYLFYDDSIALSEEAMKKLRVISEYTELGSGFKVAMKDLEIRGAGNMLGPEQHGDILAVGFSLYCKLLTDAVKELRKKSENPELFEELVEEDELYLDIKYSGYIPDSYISDTKEKIEIYKKISGVVYPEDLERIESLLMDKYGKIPPEVKRLLYIGEIRILCRKVGIVQMVEKITETKTETIDIIEIEFACTDKMDLMRLMSVVSSSKGRIFLKGSHPSSVFIRLDEDSTIEDKGKSIIAVIEQLF